MNLRVVFLLVFLSISCSRDYQETRVSFEDYEIENGFVLNALAAEPLIEAPVALSFDSNGRLWVLEMSGYMPNIAGTDETKPVGRILVLEDKDKDGQMDHAKVFLDSLVLGRAMAHVYGGLLYAEPPNLYFTEINKNLSPGNTVLVDSTYTIGGNVEHQPNGLLMNIDNWIYNAKGTKKYRFKNGKWEIETTSFRGQWGITHDKIGRLIYNDNSNQVRGDFTIPNILNQNAIFKPKIGIGSNLVLDQKVYPLQATAVNRGYLPHMLHEDGKLKNFTSACGPIYFQGTHFPTNYQGNVFVSGPEANLVKRNILEEDQLRLNGAQALENKEFIRSSDQAFRPVNLYNGPDGALYIVDMHRGIIQHKTYMTGYLRKQYIARGLDTIKGMGRIIRVTHKNNSSFTSMNLSQLSPSHWVDSLTSKNVWVRDRAQQLIIQGRHMDQISRLQKLVRLHPEESTRIHALYTLEGLDALNQELLNVIDATANPALTAHRLILLASKKNTLSKENISNLISIENEMIDYHLAFFLAKKPDQFQGFYLKQLLERYDEADWFMEAVYAGIAGVEKEFIKHSKPTQKTVKFLDSLLVATENSSKKDRINSDQLTRGLALFKAHCATCHGPDGYGIENLAPPLLNSEYVSGSKARLIAIMLYGLSGPLTVNNKNYNLPAAMPGIGINTSVTDEEISAIGNYIRNAFTTSPQDLNPELVDSLRQTSRPLDKIFTTKELYETFPIID